MCVLPSGNKPIFAELQFNNSPLCFPDPHESLANARENYAKAISEPNANPIGRVSGCCCHKKQTCRGLGVTFLDLVVSGLLTRGGGKARMRGMKGEEEGKEGLRWRRGKRKERGGREEAKTIMSFPRPCQSASQSMLHSVT